MENLLEHKTFTFRQVHEELEMENSLLLKEHNIQDFSEKSNFLNDIGFRNSKATKMYQAIVDSEDYRKEFNRRYNGVYKFILREQLERVCEKYNLFVRKLKHFAGDIPEKNIKDMMNFKISPKDIFNFSDEIIWAYLTKNLRSLQGSQINTEDMIFIDNLRVKDIDFDKRIELIKSKKDFVSIEIFKYCEIDIDKFISLNELNKYHKKLIFGIDKLLNIYEMKPIPRMYGGSRDNDDLTRQLTGGDFTKGIGFGGLQIAAISSLFLSDAFHKDNSRLGDFTTELQATGQVDLDPIVMLRNDRGYIIITAWGDEANDELIVNHNHN